jgi:hypothetical protein
VTPAQRAVLVGVLDPAGRGPVTVAGEDARRLCDWIRHERLTGPAMEAIDAGALQIVDDDLAHAIRSAHVAALRSSLAAEATGVRAIVALRSSGIDPHVIKGMANAHLDYGDPSNRTFADADVLVRRSDLPRAIAALIDAGFCRSPTTVGARWEARFARAVEFRHTDGVELDLHVEVAAGWFGRILDHDRLRASSDYVLLGGVDCATLGPPGRFVVSAYASQLSRGPHLRLLRDLAQQLLVTKADWRAAVMLADDGAAVIAAALLELAELTGLDHDAVDWARSVSPSSPAARALSLAEQGRTVGWSADARSTAMALGVVERCRFVAGIVAARSRRWAARPNSGD